jgi:hypothetical protein
MGEFRTMLSPSKGELSKRAGGLSNQAGCHILLSHEPVVAYGERYELADGVIIRPLGTLRREAV